MTPAEHLAAIAAKCRANLALAEKRTPGKWICDGYNVKQPHGRQVADAGPHHTPPSEYPRSCKIADEANGAYIAACAGAAEAGWRATIAAIEGLQKLELSFESDGVADEAIDAIIAAWPEEIL